MLAPPTYTFVLPIDSVAYLPPLEDIVPGAVVWLRVGRSWQPQRRVDPTVWPNILGIEVRCSITCAWLADAWIKSVRVPVLSTREYGTECVPYFGLDPAWYRDYGRTLVEAAVARGELKPHAAEKVTSYQLAGVGMMGTRPFGLYRWPPGSGKTFGALAAALSRPGPILVICPSMARKEWRASGRGRSSVDKFTNLETHVVLPASRRPVHYESMADYVARMQAERRRPVVVVGMEALADHQREIQACLDYTIVVIDELHMLGDAKRWSVTALQDGSVQIEKAKTAGDSGKRNVAAMELLHSPRVTLRLGLTGTPLEDGRPRRLWAPGDLLMPGAFGRYSSFRQRYCGFHRNEAGFMDDGGASHIDELRQRWSFALYDVPRSVTHAELPPLRIDVGYLAPPDRVDVPEVERQNKPDAMLRELRALEKAAANPEATVASLMRRREGRLAEAASRVRNACRLRAKEHLVGGPGKVMVLLTRHKMVEAWANYWRESFPGVQGWALHGDNTTEAERDRAIEAYAEHPGPCWLIGTGDAIGTSKDGMQCSDLGIVAQLPAQPGRFIQWIGRWDRLGGKGTTVFIPVAEGTEADKEIARLVRKFGPIDRFLEDEELRVLARKLSGLDREGILDEAISGMLTGSEGKEEWED